MIVEATTLLGLPVRSSIGGALGTVDRCAFEGAEAKLVGFQVRQSGVLQRFKGLLFADVLSVSRRTVIVDQADVLQPKLEPFDALYKQTGPILGLSAKTESGKSLGRISDVLIDSESGMIVRFCLRHFLSERIIPRQYLVAITPNAVIFKDVVDQPIFNQVAGVESLAS